MTIKHRESIQNFSQQKKVLVFDEKKGELSETADTELLQVSNVQHKLWKTLWHSASHQQQVAKHGRNVEQFTQNRGKVEDKGDYSNKEMQLDNEHVNGENKTDGNNDHLLILAHSAELMLESDSLDGTHGNDQNHEGLHITTMAQHSSESVSHATVADYKSSGKQLESSPVIDCVRIEEDGFQWGGRTARLSQIRRQARLKSNLLAQKKMEDSTVEHLQGNVRLSQIQHQAGFKDHSLLQERMQKYSCGDSQGRIVRLSELRRQARSICNSLVQETIEDHKHWHLDCQTTEDDEKKRIIADIFGEEDGSRAVSNEVQGKIISVRGRMRLSQLRREARLGNAGTMDSECNCTTTDKG